MRTIVLGADLFNGSFVDEFADAIWVVSALVPRPG